MNSAKRFDFSSLAMTNAIGPQNQMLTLVDKVADLQCMVNAGYRSEAILHALESLRELAESCFQGHRDTVRHSGRVMKAGHLETHEGILRQISYVRLRAEYGDTNDLLAQLLFLDRRLNSYLFEELSNPLLE